MTRDTRGDDKETYIYGCVHTLYCVLTTSTHKGGTKKMTTLLKLQLKVKKRSNTRPKSLILHIPAKARDIMEFEHDSDICLEICEENNNKIMKIRKID